MKSPELRFRQVHLDFHTSGAIGNIAGEFDPEAFGQTLSAAHVDSITCFARCHHGWLYYPSVKFPHRIHPHLQRPNLLGEQIEACHRRDIRCPIYITVQWDQLACEAHPEWICRDHTGAPITESQETQSHYDAYQPGFYRFLCVNSPYRDYLKAVTQEVMEMLPTDGIFYDIVKPVACSCTFCRAAMAERDLDASDPAVRSAFGREVISDFMHDMSALVRSIASEATVFYNSSHVSPGHQPWKDAFTHLELESLPSGGWGYAHFPLTQRYARTLGLPTMGMTGKFHTSWGDFHSFKNPAALEFECFHAVALNARCSVGDQLHPEGRICPHTYELIGGVYERIERIEPWCRGATAVTDIAVLGTGDFAEGTFKELPAALLGATRMLQELALQFDIVDEQADLSDYRLLILPDEAVLSQAGVEAIKAFVADGGAVLASYHSGLGWEGRGEALNILPVEPVAEAPFSPDFVVPKTMLTDELAPIEHTMYERGMQVTPATNAAVLAETAVPYFNRTWEHFCSHRHTPSSGEIGYPAVVRKGGVIYFAHPIFSQYALNAPRWCKQMLAGAVDMLLPSPVLRLENAPSTVIATVNDQPDRKRFVVHLLHYIPERRGQAFDTVEDVIPLHDVKVSVRADLPLKEARLVPCGESLETTGTNARLEFTVPRVAGWQVVEVSYE
ncbi:MAG: beta-galactosidase trimerization domain-containing protein [Phycisphaerae bacterium]